MNSRASSFNGVAQVFVRACNSELYFRVPGAARVFLAILCYGGCSYGVQSSAGSLMAAKVQKT